MSTRIGVCNRRVCCIFNDVNQSWLAEIAKGKLNMKARERAISMAPSRLVEWDGIRVKQPEQGEALCVAQGQTQIFT